MAFENRAKSIATAATTKILGELEFVRQSKNLTDDLLIFEGSPQDIFYDVDEEGTNLPDIVPNKSAFFVRIKSFGTKPATIGAFLALITSVSKFQLHRGVLRLEAHYVRLNVDDQAPQVPPTTLVPYPSRQFEYSGNLVMLYEGDTNYLSDHIVRNMRSFAYADKVYYLHKTYTIKIPIGQGDNIDRPLVAVGILATASPKKIVDTETMETAIKYAMSAFNFRGMAVDYRGARFGIGED